MSGAKRVYRCRSFQLIFFGLALVALGILFAVGPIREEHPGQGFSFRWVGAVPILMGAGMIGAYAWQRIEIVDDTLTSYNFLGKISAVVRLDKPFRVVLAGSTDAAEPIYEVRDGFQAVTFCGGYADGDELLRRLGGVKPS